MQNDADVLPSYSGDNGGGGLRVIEGFGFGPWLNGGRRQWHGYLSSAHTRNVT